MGGLTDASTITIGGTKEGAVIGTAAYMSPEQARGQTVDKRTDIWAFGCVLYEMLTGRQAFPGPTISDAIASILEREPDWTALPPTTPLAVGKLLRRCLAKDLRQRLADARDARLEIEDALSAAEPASTLPALAAAQRGQFTGRSRRAIAVAAGAVLLIAGVLTGIFVSRTPRLVAPRMTRTTIVTSATDPMKGVGITRAIAISADGRRLAYRSVGAIVVRPLDELASTTLAGVGLANHPFFSPDGQWIGFVDDDGVTNPLKKVAIAGGPAVTLAQTGGGLRGACWNADGTIVFATGDPATGLLSVSAAGGKPEVLTVPDQAAGELDHIWPEALPGSAGVLFTIQSAKGGIDQSQVAVLDLRTRNQRVLVHGGSDAQYVPPGHLVYAASGPTLRAVRFDLARLEVVGAPVPVLEDVATTLAFAAEASVAADGTLIYRPAQAMSQITLVWVDRQGREEPLGAPPRAYNALALSPDGTRLAVGAFDQEQDVWLWNVGRQSPLTRLTVDPAGDAMPVWTPDGRRLIWMSLRAGPPNLYTQAADGTGTPERLTNSPNYQRPSSVTPDGKQLVLWEDQPDRGTDLMLLNLEGTHTVTPLLATPFRESRGMVSPDGKWLVYESNESGKYEIYVRPFPNVDAGKWPISSDGGVQPLWAKNGHELFYIGPDWAIRAANWDVQGGRFTASPPRKLGGSVQFTGGAFQFYDVAPDGSRFLTIKPNDASRAAAEVIVVVQNWVEELKRLLPR